MDVGNPHVKKYLRSTSATVAARLRHDVFTIFGAHLRDVVRGVVLKRRYRVVAFGLALAKCRRCILDGRDIHSSLLALKRVAVNDSRGMSQVGVGCHNARWPPSWLYVSSALCCCFPFGFDSERWLPRLARQSTFFCHGCLHELALVAERPTDACPCAVARHALPS